MTTSPVITDNGQGFALAHLNAAWADLTAAHRHAVEAATGLSDARLSRAVELAELIADGLAFTRRLSFVVTGDMRAEAAQR
jgi:hypothetical protein